MPLKQKLYCHTLGCKMGYAVKGIMRLLRSKFEEKGIKLTLEQYFVLNILNNEEGLILQELANIVDRDKSAVLRLINGLEENHFVARTTDTEDKRRKILLVTKPGLKELRKATTLEKQMNASITDGIPQEKVQELEDLLTTIYKTAIANQEG